MAIFVTVFLLVGIVMLSMYIYMLADSSLVRQDLDISVIFIRLVAGFTEPDDGTWFKTFSTGVNIEYENAECSTNDWN